MSTDRARRVPGATYRLQLHEGFTLDDAAGIVDYLADLGVTHVYCSPILQAAQGSTHGYDTIDHAAVSAELGGRAAFDRLSSAARARGLGIVLDIVPNHMAVNVSGNAQWWDVLKAGRSSEYAAWFDIDWDSPASPGQVFLPVLGAELGDVLAAGELRIDSGETGQVVAYYDTFFPVAPGTGVGSVREVLARQHYRLAFWRQASALNYRRFFDVTTLAGLRVEDEAVFDATHALILSLVDAGQVDGLRVDHPDGLADPAAYFARLHERSGGAWSVAEKILEPGEALVRNWAVDGTTGYDALNHVNSVFVDPAAAADLESIVAVTDGGTASWSDRVYDAKKQVLEQLFAAEVDWLVRVARMPAADEDVQAALREILACFPVYRSYLRTGEAPSADDLHAINISREHALSRAPHLADAIDSLLAAIIDTSRDSELRTRFQQTTGPVMAKGVEDTAFYRYHRLISLNEVGGDPGLFGLTVADCHATSRTRQAEWPATMTALSTHDTKRSEDVRARVSLLAQCPAEWADVVRGWMRHNEQHWSGEPDHNAEYLLYQTMVGAWPITPDRLGAYLEKATREAKQATSWIDPQPDYDEALQLFVSRISGDDDFMRQLEEFARPLVAAGRVASMAQKLVQLTMPGLPDIYQGTELWDLSLVDPDNRRPVDFRRHRRLLGQLQAMSVGEVLARGDEGLPKMLVVLRSLAVRARLPEVFSRGDYRPLLPAGADHDLVLAFSRAETVVTVVPRFALRAPAPAAAVTLPAGHWRNEFTGTEYISTENIGGVEVAELLEDFPVALLSKK